MTQSANEIVQSLAGQWSDLLVQILQSMTDQKPKAEWNKKKKAGPPPSPFAAMQYQPKPGQTPPAKKP